MSQRSLVDCGVSKKCRAGEESSTLITQIYIELYRVEYTINDNTAPLLQRFYKYFIYKTVFNTCIKWYIEYRSICIDTKLRISYQKNTALQETVVEAPSLYAFKSRLNNHWKNHPVKFEAACYQAGPSEGQYRNAPQEVGETYIGVDNHRYLGSVIFVFKDTLTTTLNHKTWFILLDKVLKRPYSRSLLKITNFPKWK